MLLTKRSQLPPRSRFETSLIQLSRFTPKSIVLRPDTVLARARNIQKIVLILLL